MTRKAKTSSKKYGIDWPSFVPIILGWKNQTPSLFSFDILHTKMTCIGKSLNIRITFVQAICTLP
jgi:hypothetical protein